jgi:hypothetical protein
LILRIKAGLKQAVLLTNLAGETWYHEGTGQVFRCTDNSVGAAVWEKEVFISDLPGVNTSGVFGARMGTQTTLATQNEFVETGMTPVPEESIYDVTITVTGKNLDRAYLEARSSSGTVLYYADQIMPNAEQGTTGGVEEVGLSNLEQVNVRVVSKYTGTDEALKPVVDNLGFVARKVSVATYNPNSFGIESDRRPTINDDVTKSPMNTIGQTWLYTVDQSIYRCLSNSPGAAIWEKEVFASDLIGLETDAGTSFYIPSGVIETPYNDSWQVPVGAGGLYDLTVLLNTSGSLPISTSLNVEGSSVIVSNDSNYESKLIAELAENDTVTFNAIPSTNPWVSITTGSGAPSWANPIGIAIEDGVIYIADNNLKQIWKRDLDGTWTDLSGGTGAPAWQAPIGIAVYKGEVFVADTGLNQIWKKGLNGGWNDISGGTGAPTWANPLGVAVENGIVYVVDNDIDQIWKKDIDDTWTDISGGTGAPTWSNLIGIAVDGGDIYVTDSTLGQIWKKDTTDTWTDISGGAGAPTWDTPRGISVSNGEVYVADIILKQFWKKDTNNTWINVASGPGTPAWSSPTAIIEENGEYFAVDYGLDQIWKKREVRIERGFASVIKRRSAIYTASTESEFGIVQPRNPTATDDKSSNLPIRTGQIWTNELTGEKFICVDDSFGEAVWDEIISRSQLPGAEDLLDAITPISWEGKNANGTGETYQEIPDTDNKLTKFFDLFEAPKTARLLLKSNAVVRMENAENPDSNGGIKYRKVIVFGLYKTDADDVTSLVKTWVAPFHQENSTSIHSTYYGNLNLNEIVDVVGGETYSLYGFVPDQTWTGSSYIKIGGDTLETDYIGSTTDNSINNLYITEMPKTRYVNTDILSLGIAEERDPTTSDDRLSNALIVNGQMWINVTNGRTYICRNASDGEWVRIATTEEEIPPIGQFLNEITTMTISNNGTYYINDSTTTADNAVTVDASVNWFMIHPWDEQMTAGDGVEITLPLDDLGITTKKVKYETRRPLMFFRPGTYDAEQAKRWKVTDMCGKNYTLSTVADSTDTLDEAVFPPIIFNASKNRYEIGMKSGQSNSLKNYGNNDLMTYVDMETLFPQIAGTFDGYVGSDSFNELGTLKFLRGAEIRICAYRDSRQGFIITLDKVGGPNNYRFTGSVVITDNTGNKSHYIPVTSIESNDGDPSIDKARSLGGWNLSDSNTPTDDGKVDIRTEPTRMVPTDLSVNGQIFISLRDDAITNRAIDGGIIHFSLAQYWNTTGDSYVQYQFDGVSTR